MTSSQLASVSRGTLGDSVYDSIRAAVIEHLIAPGDRLGIESMARELGVSPTPVREALARLSAEGLATYEPLVGYRVSEPLNPLQFDQLMEARFVMEPRLAALAAQRYGQRPGPDLRSLATGKTMTQKSSGIGGTSNTDYRASAAGDAALHQAIADAARSSFLADALAALGSHLHIYRLHNPVDSRTESLQEHLAIVDAIEAGDPVGAEAAMLAHLDGSYHRHSVGLKVEEG